MMSTKNGAKVIIVGQNPGNNKKAFYFRNHTIDRLNQWCTELGLHTYGFVNAVSKQGECKIKDADFDLLEACVSCHDKVVALGSFASACLDRINISHYKLPHPSPRNRLMNDKEYVRRVLNKCKEYINE